MHKTKINKTKNKINADAKPKPKKTQAKVYPFGALAAVPPIISDSKEVELTWPSEWQSGHRGVCVIFWQQLGKDSAATTEAAGTQ